MTSSTLPPLTPTRIAPPPREIDWLCVGVWAGAVVVLCVVWGGIALAIAALVG